MATRIIDEFSVKPSGFLASWRYVRVLVDDNGNLSVTSVPGKPFANLSCISDYNKKNRRYANDQLITTFCNYETFTNYRVYAQNCSPFAYVQTDLNATQCGYLAPLPTPIVPPNPFGEPVYGEYYYFDYCDIDHTAISVKIYKKSYAGVPIQVEEGGKSPVVLSRTTSDTDAKNAPIRATECILTFNALADFQYQKFYTDDEREYRVEVRKDNSLVFMGYVTPDSAMEPFLTPPYAVTLRATDGLGALKNISYPVPYGSSLELRQTPLDILAFCLAMTNLPLDIRTVCNLYEAKMLNTLDDDPLSQCTVNPLRMADAKGNIDTAYDALIHLCDLFQAFIVQDNGAWNFVRYAEQANAVARRRVYNSTGLFLYAENVDQLRQAGKDADVLLINKDHSLRRGNAFKRASTLLKFGEVPAIVFNGDFEIYDGQNFAYWTRFGSIDLSQVQRAIRGSGGETILINDYALQFNAKADQSKYLEANPIFISKGDKIALSLDIANPGVANTFKLRVKVGDYYLYNAPTTTEYQWVTSLATASFNISSSYVASTNYNFVNYTLNMTECPASGPMSIQLFGFTVLISGGVETDFFYVPVQVDNVNAAIDHPDGKNIPDGSMNVSEQLGFYTSSSETLELVYGDFSPGYTITDVPFNFTIDFGNLFNLVGGNQFVSLPYQSLLDTGVIQDLINNIYAIYTVDGSYSTSWYEYGTSSTALPIALQAAKTILKAYQQPFWFMEGSYKGENLSYLDVYQFDVPNNAPFSNRLFSILQGDFDLKYNTLTNATIVEIFSKNINSSDVTVPHSPGDNLPPITQNPNNPSPDSLTGIFTDEFTEQFL